MDAAVARKSFLAALDDDAVFTAVDGGDNSDDDNDGDGDDDGELLMGHAKEWGWKETGERNLGVKDRQQQGQQQEVTAAAEAKRSTASSALSATWNGEMMTLDPMAHGNMYSDLIINGGSGGSDDSTFFAADKNAHDVSKVLSPLALADRPPSPRRQSDPLAGGSVPRFVDSQHLPPHQTDSDRRHDRSEDDDHDDHDDDDHDHLHPHPHYHRANVDPVGGASVEGESKNAAGIETNGGGGGGGGRGEVGSRDNIDKGGRGGGAEGAAAGRGLRGKNGCVCVMVTTRMSYKVKRAKYS